MPLITRASKGSNLTPAEADADLEYLEDLANEKVAQTDYDIEIALKAPVASPTFTGTVLGITKSMVGLGSVDNTADASKPVSTAQQTALDLKLNISTVVNDLTTGGAAVPLSAAQGVALKALIDAIPSSSTTYAAQSANQASYTLDANNTNTNFSISNNLTAVTLLFSNLAVGKKAIVKYSKTTASGCTLTFAASTAIYNEDGNLETGVTSVLSASTTTGIYKIIAENIDGLITVDITKWKA